MQPLDRAVQEYLAALTERTQLLLLSDLIGVYAAGSLALDSYQPDRSDIDIAIVCTAELSMATKEAIVAALRHEALPCPARGLELVVYRSEIAVAGTSEPGFEVELNTGPRMDFRATYSGTDRLERDGTFWYAVDRSILADSGRVLVGPPSPQVFRSVPDDQLILLLIASLRWHLGGTGSVAAASASAGSATAGSATAGFASAGSGTAGDPPEDEYASWTDDAVLNACRAWQRMRTGHWSSKTEAGRALLARRGTDGSRSTVGDILPDGAVIEQALAGRTGGPLPSVRHARQFQRVILAGLGQLALRRPQ